MTSNLTDLYKDQISFTEWLAKIGNSQADAMRIEDNFKRERLGVLFEHI